MKKIIILFIILIATDGFACSCIKLSNNFKENIASEFKSSVVIFYGKVIQKKIYKAQETDDYISNSDIIFYTFEISKVYKGEITQKRIIIKSNNDGRSCGYPFEVNKKYLVYSNYYGVNQANVSKNDLFTSICHRTNLMKNVKSKELRLLKRHSKKRKKRLDT